MGSKTEVDSKTLTEQCEDQMLKVVNLRLAYGKACVAYASRAIDYDNKVAERRVKLLKKYNFSKALTGDITHDSSVDDLLAKVKVSEDERSQETQSMINKLENIREVIAQNNRNKKDAKFGKLFKSS